MRRALAAGILLSIFIVPAFADQPITVSGCIVKASIFCTQLRTAAGTTYDISFARFGPFPGAYGTVTGTLRSNWFGSCQRSNVINPAWWTLKRNARCPLKNMPK